MSRRAALLFAALGVTWGVPYLLIKVAVGELAPSALVLARTGVAALVLLPLAARGGGLAAALRRWPALVAYVVIEIALPWLFLSRAEQALPSSTTGLLIAAVPLVGVVVAAASGRAEHLGPRGWAGMALGTAGVAALVGLDPSGADAGAVAELVVTVLGYALGPAILARWLSDVPGLAVVALSVTLTALIYLPVVLVGGDLPRRAPSAHVLEAVLVLALVCTAAAFLLLFALVREIGPVRSTMVVYVNPLVAVLAGALALHERVTAVTVVGFAAILAGSLLVARSRRAAPEPGSAPGSPGPADPGGGRARRCAQGASSRWPSTSTTTPRATRSRR